MHHTPTPAPPPPPYLENIDVMAEVSKDHNSLSSLTLRFIARRVTPSVTVIRYTEDGQTYKIFESDSDFTVSELEPELYEIRMEGLHIGTNTTFSLEVVQPAAAVHFLPLTTPAEFTEGVVHLN